ncbi:MAG: electron transport complex subunit E [Bacillota bacterium]
MLALVKAVRNGIIDENPVFRLVLGLCPSLAVTTAMVNGFWMGMAVIFVLTCSNLFIALIRGVVPSKIRIPAFIVVIATFVTIVDLMMKAYVPEMYKTLGIFIPLIVVNCIIMARAEAFASRNSPIVSVADGVGMGLGFTLSVMVIGAVRELIGTGNLNLFGFALFGQGLGSDPAMVAVLPPGAFITMGLMLALINAAQRRKAKASVGGEA